METVGARCSVAGVLGVCRDRRCLIDGVAGRDPRGMGCRRRLLFGLDLDDHWRHESGGNQAPRWRGGLQPTYSRGNHPCRWGSTSCCRRSGSDQGGAVSRQHEAYLITVGIVSVVLSWATVHTVFTLRYTRSHYQSPEGGVDFNEKDPPAYLDFVYLAFTIGMTFQVSDTDLTTKRIRRIALLHALMSYLFGAVIVALAINIVASLLGLCQVAREEDPREICIPLR